MALIDEISEKKDKEDTVDNKCHICKSIVNKLNTQLMICELCFNKQVEEALKRIDENIYKINQELVNVSTIIKRINEEFHKTDDLVLKNKFEIDLLNGEAAIAKLKIDLENNMLAYYINQRQANEFRKFSGWELFEINNKYNVETNNEAK